MLPEHVERTAFRTKLGTFAYKVVPFGLCNAPATFQKTINFILQEMREFAGAYIDDILIFTKTLDEHLVALRKVLEKLRQERFFAGPEKCSWAQPEGEYCGYILGTAGIRPQPQKLLAIGMFRMFGVSSDCVVFTNGSCPTTPLWQRH